MIKFLFTWCVLLICSQVIYSQELGSLFDAIENKPSENSLLPDTMIFTQRMF
jgi:hypothetical protein